MLIKKSGTYDTSNRLYGRKREKVWIFEDQLQKGGWEAMGYPSKNPIFFTQNFFFNGSEKLFGTSCDYVQLMWEIFWT